MTAEDRNKDAEAEIRGMIDKWAGAVRKKDIKGVMANYAPDVLTFDVVQPLRYVGLAAATKRSEDWFSAWEGAINCELRDISIAAAENVAFSHHLSHFWGMTTGGRNIDMWVRATLGFRKLDGKWMVTHQHLSVPFDPLSGQASLDLKP